MASTSNNHIFVNNHNHVYALVKTTMITEYVLILALCYSCMFNKLVYFKIVIVIVDIVNITLLLLKIILNIIVLLSVSGV